MEELQINKKRRFVQASFSVVLLGLEPSQTVPKTGVLPLHHRTITTR